MLKGTTRIELTDVHSGEKQIIEKHNMVTNALQELFSPVGMCKTASTWENSYAPYYATLLGGLLLFSGAIEEDPGNIIAPSNVRATGCAVYNVVNTTTITTRGSYNANESEVNLKNKYVKYVYDFTTSQANGPIGSVCLTSAKGGYNGYGDSQFIRTVSDMTYTIGDSTLGYAYDCASDGNTRYSGLSVGTNEYLFALDIDNDVAWYVRLESSSVLHIIRRKARIKEISIFEKPVTTKPIIEDTTIELAEAIPTENRSYHYNDEDKALYIGCASGSYMSPNGTMTILKITIPGFEVSRYTITNTTSKNINTNPVFVYRGYFYTRRNSSPYVLTRFGLTNSADTHEFGQDYATNSHTSQVTPRFGINGRIYYEYTSSSYYSCLIYNTELDEYSPMEYNYLSASYNQYSYSPMYFPVMNHPLLYYVAQYGSTSNYHYRSFRYLGNYLATINNLESPVVKTADKTMKVTYIIEEA